MDFSEKALRKAFAEKTAKRDEIRAKATPLRERRDKIVNKAREEEVALNKEIAQIEKPLFDLDMEISSLSRALSGKTGTPAEE